MKEIKTGALWMHLHWLTVLAEQGSFTRIRRQLVLPAGANYSGRIRCLVALSHAGCCLRCFF
ncbi:hypothetical protein ACFFJN_04500, partial [Erwinia mallotivora]